MPSSHSSAWAVSPLQACLLPGVRHRDAKVCHVSAANQVQGPVRLDFVYPAGNIRWLSWVATSIAMFMLRQAAQ